MNDRDQIATAAMQGILSFTDNIDWVDDHELKDKAPVEKQIAELAYRIADAMLAELLEAAKYVIERQGMNGYGLHLLKEAIANAVDAASIQLVVQ